VHGQPTSRTGKSGKPFAVAKVRAAAGDGESLFVSVIAFDAAPCTALMALRDGDSVALSGTLTPKTWADREGNTRPALDLVAHQVMTTYHVSRKRAAVRPAPPQSGRSRMARGRGSQHDRSNQGDFEPLDF